jgi:hypothetical protein
VEGLEENESGKFEPKGPLNLLDFVIKSFLGCNVKQVLLLSGAAGIKQRSTSTTVPAIIYFTTVEDGYVDAG